MVVVVDVQEGEVNLCPPGFVYKIDENLVYLRRLDESTWLAPIVLPASSSLEYIWNSQSGPAALVYTEEDLFMLLVGSRVAAAGRFDQIGNCRNIYIDSSRVICIGLFGFAIIDCYEGSVTQIPLESAGFEPKHGPQDETMVNDIAATSNGFVALISTNRSFDSHLEVACFGRRGELKWQHEMPNDFLHETVAKWLIVECTADRLKFVPGWLRTHSPTRYPNNDDHDENDEETGFVFDQWGDLNWSAESVPPPERTEPLSSMPIVEFDFNSREWSRTFLNLRRPIGAIDRRKGSLPELGAVSWKGQICVASAIQVVVNETSMAFDSLFAHTLCVINDELLIARDAHRV